jgi:hypothetical protein
LASGPGGKRLIKAAVEFHHQLVKATGMVVTIPAGVVTVTYIKPATAPEVGGAAPNENNCPALFTLPLELNTGGVDEHGHAAGAGPDDEPALVENE